MIEMSIEKFRINSEIERLELEIEEYQRLIDKARKKSKLSSIEPKTSKCTCLSSLPSLDNTQRTNKEDLENKIRRATDLLIQYGRDKI